MIVIIRKIVEGRSVLRGSLVPIGLLGLALALGLGAGACGDDGQRRAEVTVSVPEGDDSAARDAGQQLCDVLPPVDMTEVTGLEVANHGPTIDSDGHKVGCLWVFERGDDPASVEIQFWGVPAIPNPSDEDTTVDDLGDEAVVHLQSGIEVNVLDGDIAFRVTLDVEELIDPPQEQIDLAIEISRALEERI